MSEAPSRSAGLGSLLREARERAGLDLGEVASRTHVRRTYLEALENEAWDALPEDVYARNFLRLYARTVGVDPDDALARFEAARTRGTRSPRSTRVEPPAEPDRRGPEVASVPTVRRERAPRAGAAEGAPRRPRAATGRAGRTAEREPRRPALPPNLMPLLMTIVLAGALVGVAVWGFNQLLFRPDRTLAGSETPVEPDATTLESTAVPAAPGGLAAPAIPGGDTLPEEILLSVTTEPPGAEVTVDAFPLPGTTPIRNIPVSAREERTLRITREGYQDFEGTFDLSQDREVVVALDPITPAADAGAPATAGAAGAGGAEGEVVVEVTEPTWIEAYQSTARGDGQRLVYTTAQPGERFIFSRPLYLHVGNAAGLQVSVDGEPFGPLGSGGGVTGQAFPEP